MPDTQTTENRATQLVEGIKFKLSHAERWPIIQEFKTRSFLVTFMYHSLLLWTKINFTCWQVELLSSSCRQFSWKGILNFVTRSGGKLKQKKLSADDIFIECRYEQCFLNLMFPFHLSECCERHCKRFTSIEGRLHLCSIFFTQGKFQTKNPNLRWFAKRQAEDVVKIFLELRLQTQ